MLQTQGMVQHSSSLKFFWLLYSIQPESIGRRTSQTLGTMLTYWLCLTSLQVLHASGYICWSPYRTQCQALTLRVAYMTFCTENAPHAHIW